ncbi:YfbR-like 5'-deoxynucleotidase [Pseudomonas putida]|uniref:HD domain-containing protein n=1 Tax=Pseudomonas putida TaxID=303 RepID=A0A8I1JIE0_PSEPU|nr:HD domain-containing protein [Pseudomonas putida]
MEAGKTPIADLDKLTNAGADMRHLDQFGIANVANSVNVKRWGSVPTLDKPSIAEHSYLVTMYCRYLGAVIAPDMTDAEKLLMTDLALVHDLPEVKTGDMATPIKRYLESMFPKGESPLDLIEERICAPYADLREQTRGTCLAVIVKLADILEALHFITNNGKGEVTRVIARERQKAFNAYIQIGMDGWPNLQWMKAQGVLEALMHDIPEQIDFEEIIKDAPRQEI